jgi:cytoskeletal protein CcmA (bactofilin family)
MWKKSEAVASPPTSPPTTTPSRVESTGSRKARIGAGVTLKGELSGKEDVIVEGHVEGTITLEQHGVIVEDSGRVDGNITASTICVAGVVRGDLHGKEQAVLLKTGRVEGNIYAKSVTLETGAQFKGSIDMETAVAPSSASAYSKGQSGPSGVNKANGSTHSVAS